jgi:glycosyltransferase involved in cell wall biosynthesis
MGGSQYQAQLLIGRLAANHNVQVRYFAARTRRLSFPDHEVCDIGERPALRRFGHFWDYFRLQRALRSFRPDVVYQRVACAYTGISRRYATRAGVPLIWHIANQNDVLPAPSAWSLLARPHRLLESRLSKAGARRADVIIAQTADQAALLESHYGRAPDHIISNFHPEPPLPARGEAPVSVVWIANLKDAKRPELFVELAGRLQDDERLKFSMVGLPYPDAEKQAAIQARIDTLPNLDYLGAVSQEAVGKLLESAHILVNTSLWEGFSNTFIQAWMRGVAVLTLGVNPDGLLDDGVLGCSCDTVDGLENSLRGAVDNPAMLIRQGSVRRDIARERFSMHNADLLADIIVREGAGARKKRT